MSLRLNCTKLLKIKCWKVAASVKEVHVDETREPRLFEIQQSL